MIFNEFDLLTLREGLFYIKNNRDILSEEEFKQIDFKIKSVLEGLK